MLRENISKPKLLCFFIIIKIRYEKVRCMKALNAMNPF